MHINNNTSGGSDHGNKIKGVVEVVHGAGENIRGTFLGAVDTLAKEESSPDDDIAQKGRLEIERGLARLRSPKNNERTFAIRSTAPSMTSEGVSSANTTANAGSQQGIVDADGHRVSMTRTFGTGGGHGTFSNTSVEDQATSPNRTMGNVETSFPSHHRDDGVSGLPTTELHNLQDKYICPSNQTQTDQPQSEYDPSRAPYRTKDADLKPLPDGSANSTVAFNDPHYN